MLKIDGRLSFLIFDIKSYQTSTKIKVLETDAKYIFGFGTRSWIITIQ